MTPETQDDAEDRVVFGLFGAGGFAREVMPLVAGSLSDLVPHCRAASPEIFFVEPDPRDDQVNGYRVISERDFFAIECAQKLFNIAIGDSSIRARVAEECAARGLVPASIRSPHTIAYDANQVGEGAILCAYSMITSNAKIGRFFHSNLYSYVAHDCVIGDFVTFAPSVRCNGNVHIHDHAYIGTGVVIRHGSASKPLTIGEGAVVGMGAVVTKDVPPFTTVVGNPAKPQNKA